MLVFSTGQKAFIFPCCEEVTVLGQRLLGFFLKPLFQLHCNLFPMHIVMKFYSVHTRKGDFCAEPASGRKLLSVIQLFRPFFRFLHNPDHQKLYCNYTR